MASCRSIMASTSSSQSSCLPHHHQVGGKCKRSGTREFSAPLRSTPFHSSPLQSSRLHSTPLHSTPFHATPLHDPPHPTPPHPTPPTPPTPLLSSPLLSSPHLTSPHLTSPTHPLSHSPTYPHTHAPHSPTCPLTHLPTHPLTHFIHCIHLFSSIHSFQFTSFQLTKNPIGKLVPIAMSYFRNFRPVACRALPGMICGGGFAALDATFCCRMFLRVVQHRHHWPRWWSDGTFTHRHILNFHRATVRF